jgi:CRP-like cAMP-binding protein
MAVVTEQNSLLTLKKLIPLNLLSEADLEQLLKTATFKKDRAGSYLFRQGDTDYHNVYLLSGKVALLENSSEVDRVAAGSETSRFPLGHQIPRKNSAKAIGRVEYVLIDNRKLSELLVRNNDDDYKVADLNSAISDDWMDQLLQSKVFQQIPPSNIQGVIMRMEEVEVKRGQKVVEQGGEGDYFYLIHQGRCKVTRNEEGKSKATELAKLGPGDSFGEEALLSDSPRNSTVTMLTNGNLLRLSKKDFIEFVKRPLAKGVSFEEADLQVSKGAVWLDVRMPSDYEAGHLENSVSFPLDILRYQAPNLASDQKYVICCDDGHISSTAAYLLTDRGFSVSVLEGGLRNVPKEMLIKDDAGSAESRAKVITLRPGEEVADEKLVSVDTKQQEKLKEQLAAANKRIKELGVKFQRYREKQQKDEAQLKAEVKAQQAIIDKSRIRLDELKAKREVDRRLVEQLQKESDELKLSLKESAEQLSISEGRIADLEAAQNKEQDSEQVIAVERDEHKKQLHDYKQQLDNAVAERDSLENSLNELHKVHRDEVNKQAGALAKSEQQIDQFQAELVEVKEEYEKSRAELEEARGALADRGSEQQIEQLQVELAEVKEEFEKSQAELEEARGALADSGSEQQIEQLQVELAEVKD